MGIRLDNDPETPKALQRLARHQMLCRLEADILMDMRICDIEGWDKTEYIRMLNELISGFMKKIKETEETKQ